MSANWRTGLILGALGLSLLLNILALNRISELSDQVSSLQSEVGRLGNLSHDLYEIQVSLDELEQAQQWVTGLEWSVDPDAVPDGCERDLPVTASWTFRELSPESDVFLEVRHPGADWVRTEAEAVGDLTFEATSELSRGWNWEYRIVAENDGDGRMHGPKQLTEELDQLTDRSLRVEEGEFESHDGEAWFRFVVAPMSEQRSPCNEIVAATLNLSEDGELIETVSMDADYPGPHRPETDDGDASGSNRSASDDATEVDPAVPFAFDTGAWWSDWVRLHDTYDVEVVVEFADGTERTEPHPLNMVPTR